VEIITPTALLETAAMSPLTIPALPVGFLAIAELLVIVMEIAAVPCNVREVREIFAII
jgi:hypothetical protein